MQYLLIDFGASYIKTTIFDNETDTFTSQKYYESPFLKNNSISKQELMELLNTIVISNPSDGVVICTILGGHYEDDVYYSWKSNKPPKKNECLISGLFVESDNFHIHSHHKNFTSAEQYDDSLRVLGYINGIPVYSSLGDTYCVINSVDLQDDEVGINLGTGSQVFYKNTVHMYIPSGRTFLAFQRMFQEFGFDMFSYMKTLTFEDIITSTLKVDLNIFSSAHKFIDGGKIELLTEQNMTKKNLVSSLIREYVIQYKPLIPSDTKRIYLLGGMSRKITNIQELFSYYYNVEVLTNNSSIENTHIGMSKLIKRYL